MQLVRQRLGLQVGFKEPDMISIGIGLGFGMAHKSGDTAPLPANALVDDEENVLTTDESEILLAGET